MTESFDRQEFIRVKTAAEQFYKAIIKIYCPALSSDVHFSSDGFHHLQFNDTRVERNKSVQKTKFLCLKEAVNILKKTTTTQEFRIMTRPIGKPNVSGSRNAKTVEYFAFLAITDFQKRRRINVVVRRVGNGNFHFWSVMPSWRVNGQDTDYTARKIGGIWMLNE